MNEKKSDKRSFWNDRAWKGEYAGTNDLLIKQLELAELEKHFSNGTNVLEIGCGNGQSALYLAQRFDIKIHATDFSEEMIAAANASLKSNLKLAEKVTFSVADIRDFQTTNKYDIIYSQRSLINLDSWVEQKSAIEKILNWLSPSGRFLMCENSRDGLEKINEYRKALDLGEIKAPWHNNYLNERDVAAVSVKGCLLDAVYPFSSTYYFLSRVINAALAAQVNEDPSYDSAVNKLALRLPPISDCGQTKLWVWRKAP